MNVYEYIKQETDPNKLYDGVRKILWDRVVRGKRYPEDWEIKKIQRLADARYAELVGD